MLERFSYDLKRNKTGWLSERSGERNFMPKELSRNQWIRRFDVILQHDRPIEQCLLHIGVFFGEETKNPCFDLFIHWLIKQITNTYRNYFLWSYDNRTMRSSAFLNTSNRWPSYLQVLNSVF